MVAVYQPFIKLVIDWLVDWLTDWLTDWLNSISNSWVLIKFANMARYCVMVKLYIFLIPVLIYRSVRDETWSLLHVQYLQPLWDEFSQYDVTTFTEMTVRLRAFLSLLWANESENLTNGRSKLFWRNAVTSDSCLYFLESPYWRSYRPL